MPQPPDSPTAWTLRRVLVAAGVVVALAGGALQLDRLFRGGLNAPLDFAEYWSAGALNAAGQNPYSGANVRAVQRDLGLNDTAIMMWNPPWALTIVMPLGALPFRTAYGMWIVFHLALLAASVELLWRAYGGPPRLRLVAHLLALTFAPTVFLIGGGQITTVALFGLAGFAYCARADRPLAAGCFAALTAIKPHLLALLALWLILDATRTAFGRKVLLGGVIVGTVACIPPTVANPDVWAQYWAAAVGPSSADHNHVAEWKPPVLGWWLRRVVPDRPFALQWLPLACAAGAFMVWWRRNRDGAPDRLARLPWVVGLSLVVAPYGAWMFDLVLMLVPVLAVAARRANAPDRRAVAASIAWLASAGAAALVMMVNGVSSEWYVCFAPCVLAGCAALRPNPAPLPYPRPAEAAPAGDGRPNREAAIPSAAALAPLLAAERLRGESSS